VQSDIEIADALVDPGVVAAGLRRRIRVLRCFRARRLRVRRPPDLKFRLRGVLREGALDGVRIQLPVEAHRRKSHLQIDSYARPIQANRFRGVNRRSRLRKQDGALPSGTGMIEVHLDRNRFGRERHSAFPMSGKIILCVKKSRAEENRDENGRTHYRAYNSKRIILALHAGLT